MQSLAPDEIILFQAMPFNSLSKIFYMAANLLGLIIIFPTSLLLDTYLNLYIFLILFILLKSFDKITITNQRIFLRIFLITRTINLNRIAHSPYLTIPPHTFKKYEWHRKLLKQDFNKFWQHKASIYFPVNKNSQLSTFLSKPLIYLRLSFFSKKQSKQVLQILAKHWQLDSSIQLPEKLTNKRQS